MIKIAKNLGIALAVFVIVVGAGLTGWYYSKGWRAEKSGHYLAQSEEYLDANDQEALWELEKAYLVGMDYTQYRIKRAIALIRLEDRDAVSEAEILIRKKMVNDELFFWYSQFLFSRGDFDLAEKYTLLINGNLTSEYQGEYKKMMAYWAGTHANWDQSVEYINDAVNDKSELQNNMKIILAVLEDDQTMLAETKKSDQLLEKISQLKDTNGDLYALKLAEMMNDMKLTSWARALMDGYVWESAEKKSRYLVYGRSWLIEGNCSEAWRYFQEAKNEDVIDKNTANLLAVAEECGDK